MKPIRLFLATVFVAGLPHVAHAQSQLALQITDKSGSVTTITQLDIDYSNYPGGFGTYTPDHERQGIRLRQGQGTTTVTWQNVASIIIEPEPVYSVAVKCDHEMQPFTASEKAKWEALKKGACRWTETYKFSGRLQLTSGRSVTGEIIAPSRDLKGKSELGDFSIALKDVREIKPINTARK